jgi:hypothetical protein
MPASESREASRSPLPPRSPTSATGSTFDMDAVHADYMHEINTRVPVGVAVAANGMVFAVVDVAEEAREIDWQAIADDIDVAAIFQRHDVTAGTGGAQ